MEIVVPDLLSDDELLHWFEVVTIISRARPRHRRAQRGDRSRRWLPNAEPATACFVPREMPEGLSMRERWVQFQIDEMQRGLLEFEQQIAEVEFAMEQRAQLSARACR